MNPLEQLSQEQASWLAAAPSAHMATADASGAPHVIPVCYASDGRFSVLSIWTRSPNGPRLPRLRRVRNIQENPQVSLVVDHYEDDWSRLGYILVLGKAELLLGGGERDAAVRLLRRKYPQYRTMDVDANPVIKDNAPAGGLLGRRANVDIAPCFMPG